MSYHRSYKSVNAPQGTHINIFAPPASHVNLSKDTEEMGRNTMQGGTSFSYNGIDDRGRIEYLRRVNNASSMRPCCKVS